MFSHKKYKQIENVTQYQQSNQYIVHKYQNQFQQNSVEIIINWIQ